jgi:hypothetical protein
MSKKQGPIEEVISLISSAKEHLETLSNAYSQLPPLLSEEHEAIKNHDIQSLELLTETKNEIADIMDSVGSKLKRNVMAVAHVHAQVLEVPAPKEVSLSQTTHMVSDLIGFFRRDGLATQVLSHVNERLEKLINEFLALEKRHRPMIESTKYLIQKLIQNNEAMYKFWAEVSQEISANYDQKGTKRPSGHQSLLNVKA